MDEIRKRIAKLKEILEKRQGEEVTRQASSSTPFVNLPIAKVEKNSNFVNQTTF